MHAQSEFEDLLARCIRARRVLLHFLRAARRSPNSKELAQTLMLKIVTLNDVIVAWTCNQQPSIHNAARSAEAICDELG